MEDLRKTYRTSVVIGLAMMAGVFVYAVIVEFLRKGGMPAAVPELSRERMTVVRLAFYGLSAIMFMLIRFLDRRMLSGKDLPAGGRNARKPRGAEISPQILQQLLASSIRTYVLCEVPALSGLVAFFLSRDAMDFYTLMLISLFFFSRFFPKYNQWENLVQNGRIQGRGRR